jgi:hypothetical protein
MKRMTPQYPFTCEEKTPDDAVFLNRPICIGGTRRIISTTGGKMRRNSPLVKPYQQKKPLPGEVKLFLEV